MPFVSSPQSKFDPGPASAAPLSSVIAKADPAGDPSWTTEQFSEDAGTRLNKVLLPYLADPEAAVPEGLLTSDFRSTPLRPTILTVDDAKAVRLLTQRALAAFDCDLSEAPNGYNALFAMERALPDLILLDVNMPTMGGIEMLTMLRSNPTLAAIPVIMLTSPADHGVMAQLTALGDRNLAGTCPATDRLRAFVAELVSYPSHPDATRPCSNAEANDSRDSPVNR